MRFARIGICGHSKTRRRGGRFSRSRLNYSPTARITTRASGANSDTSKLNLGFEHFFTGHAGLLGFRQAAKASPESPEEARFLAAMERPENLRNYQEKTADNIRRLFEWVRRIEKAVPVERLRLWSEGEENLEARMEEILAAR